MPEFAPGSSHTATLPVAVAPADLACEVELWLSPDGENKSASSGLVSFTSTGSQQQLSLAVDMPSEEATYHVLIDIYCEGNLIGAYQALNDVSIIAEKPVLAIERFFVVTTPVADKGDFEVHCRIKNTGDVAGTGQINLVGKIFIAGGQLEREIDETQEFALEPGKVYDYSYSWSSYKGDKAWVKVIGDWGEETPAMSFTVGFAYGTEVEVELECTDVGTDYAILRYTQRSMCDAWDFRCRTPPPPADPEQVITYPRLKLPERWASIYHTMLGLLSGRTYQGYCSGGRTGAAWRSDRTTFNTK